MKRYICDGIVKGATHVRNQMPCQDNKRIVEISDKIANHRSCRRTWKF